MTRPKDFNTSSGASAVVKKPGHFQVRKFLSQVRSPGIPDAAKGSPDLNDLTDCTLHLVNV